MSARPGTGQRPGPVYQARQQVERTEIATLNNSLHTSKAGYDTDHHVRFTC